MHDKSAVYKNILRYFLCKIDEYSFTPLAQSESFAIGNSYMDTVKWKKIIYLCKSLIFILYKDLHVYMHIDNNCFGKSARSATVISDIKGITVYHLTYSKVHGFNKWYHTSHSKLFLPASTGKSYLCTASADFLHAVHRTPP